MSVTLEEALKLWSMGWHILPGRNGTKGPRLTNWSKEEFPTKEIIQHRFSNENVSLCVRLGENVKIPGLSSHYFLHVLDCENQAAVEVVTKIGRFGTTPAVITGNGRHYYFYSTEPLPNIQIKNEKGELQIEILGKNKCANLPPSIHPNGKKYEWFEGLHPEKCSPVIIENPNIIIREIANKNEWTITGTKTSEAKGDEDGLVFRICNLLDEKGAIFFQSQFKEPFLSIPNEPLAYSLPIKSEQTSFLLSGLAWKQFGVPLSDTEMGQIKSILSAKALYDGEQKVLYNRVGENDSSIYWDLCDGTSIKISKETIEKIETPILFRTYQHQKKISVDLGQNETIENARKTLIGIKKYFRITDENELELFLVYLCSSLIPNIPHPILKFEGVQGSGKSFSFRFVKRLIDPSIVELATFSKSKDEITQQIDEHYLAFFDNVDGLTDEQGDILCRASTGEGYQKRKLYTDSGSIYRVYRRCIGINGIAITNIRPDLMDRILAFELERIPANERKPERAIEADLLTDAPAIRGAICRIVQESLLILDEVRQDMNEFGRLADFCLFGEAIGRALGLPPNQFLSIYAKKIREQNVTVAGVLGDSINVMMEEREFWEGTPKELFNELIERSKSLGYDTDKPDTGFPNRSNELGKYLKKLKPIIAEEGFEIKLPNRPKGRRKISIKRIRKNVGTLANYDVTNNQTEIKSENSLPTRESDNVTTKSKDTTLSRRVE